jgi:hypothetical protein
MSFDFIHYPESADDRTRNPPRLAPRRPEPADAELLSQLQQLQPLGSGGGIPDAVAATAFRAGLFLWHDFLDECHQLAQGIEGEGAERLGDCWHAIMHRREPDYSNAKYWFRQINPHPYFQRLVPRAAAILEDSAAPEAPRWRERLIANAGWNPFAFVDLCELCAADEEAPLALAARRIQLAEMEELLRYTRSKL